MSRDLLVAPAPARVVVFRSVDRPELGPIGPDDVFSCPDCGHEGDAEYEASRAEWGDCTTCRGHRFLHGFGPGGYGLPAMLEGKRRGSSAPSAPSGDSVLARPRAASRDVPRVGPDMVAQPTDYRR